MTRKELAALLASQALAHEGKVALVALLEATVPLAELRELARRLGVSPKGFRIEKATAKVLAEALVDLRATTVLEETCAVLAGALVPESAPATASEPAPKEDANPLLLLRERELAQVRTRLEAAEQGLLRQRQREEEAQQRVLSERESSIRMRTELANLRRELEQARAGATTQAFDPQASQRIRELERSLEEADIVEQALRHRLAEQQSRQQALESELAELEALLPKGRRRKAPPPEPAPVKERVRMPYFSAGFYRSLVDKERRAIERAMLAVFTLCTEGPTYPGLEVKQLEGLDLWSMRAALKLRVYFRWRADGDVEIEELGDREDQHTTLRRFKER